ncbi:hypothetical protein DL766_000575 [Monosporascus sp. MC13-8B]|uniref:Uncharacterized protein n=1 Tax=Monosporascus cannonballus TaxID=155416 RepID=A0ABY0GQ41_9PEZI|nr:hypothetical protein DL762_010379 [Monosporascus cannonballus]RYO99515.1 hypothetical protein DL763_001426 [Monosporascus cannonballus]RYP39119.1 hypothetical protein DL766_000575 [Monosporascus sp. MC13-8B]
MDDPWGSPWAASDAPPKTELARPTLPETLLSPPPRAFVGSLSASPCQSPWAEDGGFGEWETWADSASQQHPTTPRLDGSGRASPFGWPASTATSPGLKPLPRSRTSSIFRQSSPEPWAAESSLNNRRNTVASLAISIQEDEGPKMGRLSEGGVTQLTGLGIEPGKSNLVENGAELKGEAVTKDAEHEIGERSVPPIITEPQELEKSAVKSILNNDVQETSPRPSSTFSRTSNREMDRQDSPITSIDEDTKSRRQGLSRKPSKVQELVGMYNGLAKTTTEELQSVDRQDITRRGERAEGSRDPNTAGREVDDGADFGDFEGAGRGEDGSRPGSSAASAVSGRPSTAKVAGEDEVPHAPVINATEPQSPPPKTKSAMKELVDKFGPINFDVDLEALDKLSPPVQSDEEPGGHAELPDRLATDSFASISERKAWYRISRFGSMRKHDSGDEDNYHRVTWSNSEARSETLKIVRRWMEEDSYTGRPVLGGSKRTSVFNWDSNAAPIDLNTIFGRKPAVHSRTSSAQQPRDSTASSMHSIGSPSVPVTASRASISSLNPSEMPSTPVASFGWSSNVHESPKVDKTISAEKSRYSIEPPRQAPVSTLGARVKAPSPIRPGTSVGDEVSDDEEEDWGEMVSSPQVETHPSIEGIVSATAEDSRAQKQPQDTPTSQTPARTNPWTFGDLSVFEAPTSTSKPAQAGDHPEKASSSHPPTAGKSQPQRQPHDIPIPQTPADNPCTFGDLSVFEAPVSSSRANDPLEKAHSSTPAAQKSQPPKLPRDIPIPQTPVGNPWDFGDLSVFEAPAGAPKAGNPLEKASSFPPTAGPEPHGTDMSAAVTVPSVAPPGQKTGALLPAPKAVLGPIEDTGAQREQDEIVRRIVQDLPDLSYMLR